MTEDKDKQHLSDKQSHILDIAQKLFAEKGFNATSVRDIAQAANVNLAMISYYFGSKDKLCFAIFKRHAVYVKIQLESLIEDQSLSPLEKMEILIDQYLDKVFGKSEFHKIMLRQQLSPVNEEIQDMIVEMKNSNQQLIKKLIQEGQKKGVYKKNVDVPMLMATMLGTAYHLLTAQKHYRVSSHLEHLSDEEFLKTLRKRLSQHLKSLFKAILTNE